MNLLEVIEAFGAKSNWRIIDSETREKQSGNSDRCKWSLILIGIGKVHQSSMLVLIRLRPIFYCLSYSSFVWIFLLPKLVIVTLRLLPSLLTWILPLLTVLSPFMFANSKVRSPLDL